MSRHSRNNMLSRGQSSAASLNSHGEVARMLHKNRTNSNKMLMLDSFHMKKLKDPKNAANKNYYQPEGYSTDHKADLNRYFEFSPSRRSRINRSLKELDRLSAKSKLKSLQRHVSNYEMDSQRPMSVQSAYHAAMNYKFKLKDLHKYSKILKYRDFDNFKFKYSALGKLIPEPDTRRRILVKGSHLNTLLRL